MSPRSKQEYVEAIFLCYKKASRKGKIRSSISSVLSTGTIAKMPLVKHWGSPIVRQAKLGVSCGVTARAGFAEVSAE
jgi:hypothetical protein